MIELKNVVKIYQAKKGNSTTALDGIHLTFPDKGMIFLVGESGSGKSTLLNIIGGLDSVTSGEVLLNGNNIGTLKDKELDMYRNTYVGFIFQEFHVLEKYDVYQNIELALKLQNIKFDKNRVDVLLQKLGLNHLGNRKMNELSGGQKQRVAIARALVKNPEIILADEPTGSLDEEAGRQIFEILKSISREKLVIVVSHDREEATQYADRIIEISDGKVVHDTLPYCEPTLKKPFIRKETHLPSSYALKMALVSLKIKPIKILMTILLTAFSLILMGVSLNAYLFDEDSFVARVLHDNQVYTYDVALNEGHNLTPEEVVPTFEKLTGSKINPVYTIISNQGSFSFFNFTYGENENNKSLFYYQKPASSYIVEVEDNNVIGPVLGRYPEKENEIVIHPYLADYMMKFGVVDENGELYFPASREELIEEKKGVQFGNVILFVSGIQEVDENPFLTSKNNSYFTDLSSFTYFKNFYLDKSRYIYAKGLKNYIENNVESSLEEILKNLNFHYENQFVSKPGKILNENVSYLTADGEFFIDFLPENEIILSLELFKQFFPDFEQEFNLYLDSHTEEVYETLLKEFLIRYIKEKDALKTLTEKVTLKNLYDDIDVQVVGISLEDIFISPSIFEQYEPLKVLSAPYMVYDDDFHHLTKSFQKMLSFYDVDQLDIKNTDKDFSYHIAFAFENDVSNVIHIHKQLKFYILIISIVFSLFALLLFSNFLATSISYAKKEIGILHSLGASKKDRIKIFGYETILIGILSWILSVFGFIMTCTFLNQSFFASSDFILHAIVLNPIILIFMLVYVFFIAFLVTVFCISKLNKLNPVDVLLNK